jgi:hypothetical protein
MHACLVLNVSACVVLQYDTYVCVLVSSTYYYLICGIIYILYKYMYMYVCMLCYATSICVHEE